MRRRREDSNAKILSISGALANSKTYDGSATATVNFGAATLVGIVTPDVVTINSSAYAASFADKNIGTSKPVTVTGVALSGAGAGNYTVPQSTGLNSSNNAN